MTYLESIILGVVEGLTEFLPVSSTGHLILVSTLLGIPQTDFVKSFEIAIQLGSILAVVVLFWKSFLDTGILKRLIVAFIPTGAIGFVLYQVIKDVLIGDPMIVVWALGLGGVVLIAVSKRFEAGAERQPNIKHITYKQAFLVGLAQSIAIIPGVSRSGATIVGGLMLGISRTTILTFSFLLAVPTMLMATMYDIYKTPEIFIDSNLTVLGVGFFTAFLVALATIRIALHIVRKFGFAPFGFYRILLALLFLMFVL